MGCKTCHCPSILEYENKTLCRSCYNKQKSKSEQYRLRRHQYYIDNRIKIIERQYNRKQVIKAQDLPRTVADIEKTRIKNRKRYLRHTDKERLRTRNYRIKRNNEYIINNWTYMCVLCVLYEQQKLAHAINKRIGHNLRSRFKAALKNNCKVGSAVRDLGCSIDAFKRYLAKQFKPGMTWDNYGHKTWHIDHVKPLDSFDLTDRKQLLEACHFTNLQPLWAKENLSKGAKTAQ